MLTAFDAFGGKRKNYSTEILEAMSVDGVDVKRIYLPTIYYKSFNVLKLEILNATPDIIVLTGEVTKRSNFVSFERFGANRIDSSAPDNLGRIIKDQKIIDGAPGLLPTTFDYEPLQKILGNNCVECGYSQSAGTYVCNELLFRTLYFLQNNYPTTQCGFLHFSRFNITTAKSTAIAMSLGQYAKLLIS
ncbi:hypothetical protein FWH58_01200 [Candidatus Saccharibacteria bacterium]|nr:hypothetical protein [Candidatus Saccharibacteria bacterium]